MPFSSLTFFFWPKYIYVASLRSPERPGLNPSARTFCFLLLYHIKTKALGSNEQLSDYSKQYSICLEVVKRADLNYSPHTHTHTHLGDSGGNSVIWWMYELTLLSYWFYITYVYTITEWKTWNLHDTLCLLYLHESGNKAIENPRKAPCISGRVSLVSTEKREDIQGTRELLREIKVHIWHPPKKESSERARLANPANTQLICTAVYLPRALQFMYLATLTQLKSLHCPSDSGFTVTYNWLYVNATDVAVREEGPALGSTNSDATKATCLTPACQWGEDELSLLDNEVGSREQGKRKE